MSEDERQGEVGRWASGAGAGAGGPGASDDDYDDDDDLFDMIPAPPKRARNLGPPPPPPPPIAPQPPIAPSLAARLPTPPPLAARLPTRPPMAARSPAPPPWGARSSSPPPSSRPIAPAHVEVPPPPRVPDTSITEPPPAVGRPSLPPPPGERGPTTWRSKPGPADGSAPPPPELAAPVPRAPTTLVPGADPEAEIERDVAPIGPTETASARTGTPATDPKGQPERPAPPQATTVEEITNQIHELEARLDSLIRQSREARGSSPGALPGPRPPPPAPSRKSVRRSPIDEEAEGVTAKELFSTDFYLRKWGRIGMRNRSEEVDEFGLDPKYEARYRPFFDFLYKHYFRVDTTGTENIPGEGRCLIVSNHSGGTLPYDGVMLRTTVRQEHPIRRDLRWLAEDFIYHLPFVGAAMNRLGAVRACQENAERLLEREGLVAVFPEGAKGTGKLYRERYQLQRFGRGGFVRLCLRTRAPLVPCAIIGAEEANPMLYRVEYMTKAIGVPYLPITPTFPALGPLGLLPAPTKWLVRFGEPMRFDEYGVDAADDEILVGRLSERVRTTIQGLLDKALTERKSIWFG